MTDDTKRARLFPWLLWPAALWVLAGAYFKLRYGTPANLPAVVRGLPLDDDLTYKLAIGIELVVVLLAFAKPRVGWLLLLVQYLIFEAVLLTQLGDESCGCFGSRYEISPTLMIVVDTVLLALLLAACPWRAQRPNGLKPLLLLALAAVLLAVPWIFDRSADAPVEIDGDGEPSGTRSYVLLEIESWQGKALADTPLARWIDMNAVIPEGLWVFYRSTCDHCAEHFRVLASEEIGMRFLTLVRLNEPEDTEANRVVHLLPEGEFVQHVDLPASVDWVLTTPGELLLENGVVLGAKEAVSPEERL